jgi:hypothetical protein
LRRVLPERKGCVVQVDHKASEDLAKRTGWTEDSLGYARDHGQRKLVRLLEAVKADVEFEGTLLAVRRVPRSPTGVHRREAAHDDRRTETADKIKKARAGREEAPSPPRRLGTIHESGASRDRDAQARSAR